jgi:2-oxoglutarate ferredoxin oxidoreductase subunit gamma
MLTKMIFSGFGGQGVLSIGLNLAHAAMLEGKHVTYLPSYGAEVRGGTANCTIAISDEEIASPVASSPDFVLAMNQPSVKRFQNQIQSGGTLFINSSLIDLEVTRGDIDVIKVPASALSEQIGNPKSANMVMLGTFVKRSNVVSISSIIKGLNEVLKGKQKLIAINEKALMEGYNLCNNSV